MQFQLSEQFTLFSDDVQYIFGSA